MRLTSLPALASIQALNRNPSEDLALVSCSATLDRSLARRRPVCFLVAYVKRRHDEPEDPQDPSGTE